MSGVSGGGGASRNPSTSRSASISRRLLRVTASIAHGSKRGPAEEGVSTVSGDNSTQCAPEETPLRPWTLDRPTNDPSEEVASSLREDAADTARREAGAMKTRTTLLELVNAVSEFAETEAEVLATVVYLVNSGTVRLCGNFAGARFNLGSIAPTPALAVAPASGRRPPS